MANKKMTKRDYFAILRESYPATADNYDEVVAFIDHELELLSKKNSSEKKPTWSIFSARLWIASFSWRKAPMPGS